MRTTCNILLTNLEKKSNTLKNKTLPYLKELNDLNFRLYNTTKHIANPARFKRSSYTNMYNTAKMQVICNLLIIQ